MVRSARKHLMNEGSVPLNFDLWISFKMLYLQVVLYDFSTSKYTATTRDFVCLFGA